MVREICIPTRERGNEGVSDSVLIGDFLRRIKRPIELDAKKHYKLVTIKMNHKGVVLRHEKVGSEIKSKMYEVKTGDFILSGIDARNGAFGIVPKELNGAIVTNDFWYFEIDENVVDKNLFLELTSTQWFDEICRKGSDGTTQRIRLQKRKFFNQEINLPPIDGQGEFISWFKQCKQKNNALSDEINRQQTLLKKLRQSILQEAIEGKLTADWRQQNPDVEPARELLARIQAEKEQLTKDKKIKKQKSLPPISEEEKPFELPEGWAWCRLEEIAKIKGGKRVSNGYKLLKKETPYIYIRVSDMSDRTISDNDLHYIDHEMRSKIERYIITKDDLYIVIVGATIGKCGAVPFKFDGMNLTENAARIIIHETNKQYLLWLMNSRFCKNQFIDRTKRVGVQKMALNRLQTTVLPLPSLKEQKAIVTKVEKLFALCDQLETHITNNQTHADQLMQAVLKEAFSQNIEPQRATAHA